MQANRGAFALLLGSGISRPARIPSGWDIVLDLVKRVAVARDQDFGSDPVRWYREQFGCDPAYSALLEQAAPTPALRRGLLNPLFVPANDDERARGVKMPTAAHKAIAVLARGGYVRVILTTNFDNLLELALEEKGVQPTVIASVDAAAGAIPLDPAMCYVVKIHGDFRDARIRNTADELQRYEKPLAMLLDRVIAEHGLVICGWSGDTDPALRDTLARSSSRRYPTYWIARSIPSGLATDLIRLRNADVIGGVTADSFFTELAERVESLEIVTAPHPLSTAMAVEMVKRYLEANQVMRLTDLMLDITGKLVSSLSEEGFAVTNESIQRKGENIADRIAKYDALCEPVVQMIATGVYWGDDEVFSLWLRVLQRLANTANQRSGLTNLIWLRRYPTLLLLYACGVAAVDARNYGALGYLFSQFRLPNIGNQLFDSPAIGLMPHIVVNDDDSRTLPNIGRYTLASNHVFNVLRSSLRALIPEDERFDHSFDYFEALMALIGVDMQLPSVTELFWLRGRFVWRGHSDFAYNLSDEFNVVENLKSEWDDAGDMWDPLQAGMFGGSSERLNKSYAYLITQVNKERHRLHWP